MKGKTSYSGGGKRDKLDVPSEKPKMSYKGAGNVKETAFNARKGGIRRPKAKK
jgi:hypothetical protein